MSAAEQRTAPEEGWASLTVDELQQELEARSLKKSGNKDELVSRLEDYDAKLEDAKAAVEDEEEAEEKPAARRASPETITETAPKAAPRDEEGAVVVAARARYVRSAPRKARLVMGHIRGKRVEQARAILTHTPRSVSGDILKLLDSAIANAEANYELDADELQVQSAYVDQGPTIKRYRPRALGRATRINKRTSHMTIELTTTEERT
jgi:large subunit ribosomal protein L22